MEDLFLEGMVEGVEGIAEAVGELGEIDLLIEWLVLWA